MTSYTRTHGGHTMTVHAPSPGASTSPRGRFEAFADGEPILGLDVETSAINDRGARHFDDGFTVRLVQFGTDTDRVGPRPGRPAATRRDRGDAV